MQTRWSRGTDRDEGDGNPVAPPENRVIFGSPRPTLRPKAAAHACAFNHSGQEPDAPWPIAATADAKADFVDNSHDNGHGGHISDRQRKAGYATADRSFRLTTIPMYRVRYRFSFPGTQYNSENRIIYLKCSFVFNLLFRAIWTVTTARRRINLWPRRSNEPVAEPARNNHTAVTCRG